MRGTSSASQVCTSCRGDMILLGIEDDHAAPGQPWAFVLITREEVYPTTPAHLVLCISTRQSCKDITLEAVRLSTVESRGESRRCNCRSRRRDAVEC